MPFHTGRPAPSFKPFVYAAAFNTSLAGTILTQPPPQDCSQRGDLCPPDPAPPDPGRQSGIFTAITMLNNDLTTFEDGYAPGNYHNDTRFMGEITARTALQWSQNNATVSLAQMVGYNNVAALGPGCRDQIRSGTPSVALGSYAMPRRSGYGRRLHHLRQWRGENRSLAGRLLSAPRTAMYSTTTHPTPSRSSIRASRI